MVVEPIKVTYDESEARSQSTVSGRVGIRDHLAGSQFHSVVIKEATEISSGLKKPVGVGAYYKQFGR